MSTLKLQRHLKRSSICTALGRGKQGLPTREKQHRARSELSELMRSWDPGQKVKTNRLTVTEEERRNQKFRETSAGFNKKIKSDAETHTYGSRKAETRRQSSVAAWVHLISLERRGCIGVECL